MDHNLDRKTPIHDETALSGHDRSRLENNLTPMDRSQPSSSPEVSPTKRRTRGRKLIPTVEGDKVIAERFRTKLCRNYLLNPDHPCPYEDRCMFAHGEHELRTAAQNMLDGLMSEEAIREFKRKGTDFLRSASLSQSTSMSESAVPMSASVVELVSATIAPRGILNEPPPLSGEADPHTLASLRLSPDANENVNFSPSSPHDAIPFAMRKKEPIARGYPRSPSDSSPSSSAGSISSVSANAHPNPVSALPLPHVQSQSRFPQEGLNVPGRVPHEERDTANRSSVPGLTYTHDPYSWRAV
jgi:hypothetical protein